MVSGKRLRISFLSHIGETFLSTTDLYQQALILLSSIFEGEGGQLLKLYHRYQEGIKSSFGVIKLRCKSIGSPHAKNIQIQVTK